MTSSSTIAFSTDVTEQEKRNNTSFHFPKFDTELQEVRVKYNLIEE